MFCPKCGIELPEGAKFCKSCGMPVSKEASMVEGKRGGTSRTFNGKMILGIIAIVVVAVIAVVIILGGKKDSSESISAENTHASQSMTDEKTQAESSTESRGTKTDNSNRGFKSAEAAIDAFFKAALSQNVEDFIACFPAEMKPDLINRYNGFRAEKYDDSTKLFRFIYLDPEDEWIYEITGTSGGELSSDYGFDVEDCLAVDVTVNVSYTQDIGFGTGKVTDSPKCTFVVAKKGGTWYVVEQSDPDIWGYGNTR